MNIIDILIAKKKSFTGETESLVRRANEAMAAAENVADKATDAQAALEAAQAAQSTYENLDTEVQTLVTAAQNAETAAADKINNVTVEDHNTSAAKAKRIKVNKNGTDTTYNLDKNYTTTGQNEDGAMTQKAITNALAAQKTELQTQINNIPISGGSSGNISGNITENDAGSIVIVGADGNITASDITEEDLIKTQIIIGSYDSPLAIGVEIDYENKTVNRLQNALGLNPGSNFDNYPMFGGRRRCIVADNGEIIAFYGEDNYVEDGSVGQVMIYQPKFYYLKSPVKTTKTNNREIIDKEIILISSIKQAGFTLHPLFIDQNGNEIDYVLLSAYEGCAYDTSANDFIRDDAQIIDVTHDKLSSIAGAKPISGTSQNFTVVNAEQMANNRGAGWKITNLAAESVNQILMVIEFSSLNLQNAFNKGVTTFNNTSNNGSSITGSTSTLGSTSGMATSTTRTNNGNTETNTVEGKCSISYRGFENPYGNMWRFVGGVKIVNNNSVSSLIYTDIQGHEHTYVSNLPTTSNWISKFGYDVSMNWALIPTECSAAANSAVPIGDFMYVDNNTNGNKCCVIGGKQSSGEYAGPFHYATDYAYNTAAYSYSARLMYIPTANTPTYIANLNKWNTEVGGE